MIAKTAEVSVTQGLIGARENERDKTELTSDLIEMVFNTKI